MFRVPNVHYWARRLGGRATCVLAEDVVLLPTARILNASGSSERILIGRQSLIGGELFVSAHGGQISIGESCFVGPGTRVWSARCIRIGNRVLISHNVNVFDSLTHSLSPRARHAHFQAIATTGHPKVIDLAEEPVTIGDDAWIGAGAIILKGVSIGNCAIIGAGSVVTHDVPEATIVAGNPARTVRTLTAQELE
jgi:acetyltransferase-like isoleucine patch superfamily enzyme